MTDIIYATKQKCEEEGGKDNSEICTAIRSLNSSRKYANINYF
jgi:hypothetical protein